MKDVAVYVAVILILIGYRNWILAIIASPFLFLYALFLIIQNEFDKRGAK